MHLLIIARYDACLLLCPCQVHKEKRDALVVEVEDTKRVYADITAAVQRATAKLANIAAGMEGM